ncbi:MAG: hypothetical protein OJF62_003359 [Pseudolabrys sp.]|jgi:hypothetical protein|nr:hypothetical protein [Pseudolabrys sp.]
MVLSFLIAVIRGLGVRRLPALAVAASAATALAVVCATMPAPRVARGVDSVPVAHLVQDEHTLIEDSLREQAQADRAADVAANQAWARERSLAETRTISRVAAIKPVPVMPAAAKPVRVSRVNEPAPQSEAVGEPLQLQAELAPPSVPRDRPVIERVRSAIASVERIPHWMTAGVQQAADWVTDLPIRTVVRLPERRFL